MSDTTPNAEQVAAQVDRVVIQLRGLHKSLDGKTLVYRRDPIFGHCGWCILTGNIVTEMQTMQWVDDLVTKPGKEGQRGVVVGSELVIAG